MKLLAASLLVLDVMLGGNARASATSYALVSWPTSGGRDMREPIQRNLKQRANGSSTRIPTELPPLCPIRLQSKHVFRVQQTGAATGGDGSG